MPIRSLILCLSLIFGLFAQADNATMVNRMLNNNPNIIDFDSFINSEVSLQTHLLSAREAESMTPDQYRQNMLKMARQADMSNPAYHRHTYRAALHETESLTTLGRAKHFSDKFFRRGDLVIPASHADLLAFLQRAERADEINDVHHFKALFAEKLWNDMKTKAQAKDQVLRISRNGRAMGISKAAKNVRGKNVHILRPGTRAGLAVAAGTIATGLLLSSDSAQAETDENSIPYEPVNAID